MTILEIAKMKTEHARFKEVLGAIVIEYSDRPRMAAYLMADSALNPPPPPPATVGEILTALEGWKIRHNCEYIAIKFNPDESGALLRGAQEDELYEFVSLQQAVDFLNL